MYQDLLFLSDALRTCAYCYAAIIVVFAFTASQLRPLSSVLNDMSRSVRCQFVPIHESRSQSLRLVLRDV